MKKIISMIAISIAMVCMFSMSTPKKAEAKVEADCIYGFLTSCGGAYYYKGSCDMSNAQLCEILDYHEASCNK